MSGDPAREHGHAVCEPGHDDERAALEAWPWKTTAEKARRIAPCGEPCGPEGCMARGCPVAR